MPDTLEYMSTANSDISSSSYAVINYVPYTFEGYSHIKVHFDYTKAFRIDCVYIRINGNTIYSGTDCSDKYYNITTGSSIETYMAITTSTCDSSDPSHINGNITVYK